MVIVALLITTEINGKIEIRFGWGLNDLHRLTPDDDERPLAVIAPAPMEAIIFLWKYARAY